MTDFSSDVEAGVAYLKTRAEVDPHRICLVGHSEGGIVAPMVAARNPAVAFIVLMAAPGVPGDQILAAQNAVALKGAGKNTEEIERALAADRDVFALLKSENGADGLEKKVREKLAGLVPESQIEAQVKILISPWFREFIKYDPVSALSKVTVPVLAINGEKDMQVMARQNLPAIRKALAGNKNCQIDGLPGLNHLFQTAKTRSPQRVR
jgi:fermentation-respiration switch protein FrsA (DUF1100 family)